MLRSLRRMSSEVVLRGRSLHCGRGHWDGGCVVTDRAQCLRMLSAVRGAYSQPFTRLLPRVAGAPKTCLLLATWRARMFCCERVISSNCGRSMASRDIQNVYVSSCVPVIDVQARDMSNDESVFTQGSPSANWK